MLTKVSAGDAAGVVIREHYLHRRPPISHAFGIRSDDWNAELVAVCTFGVPASRELQKSACPSNPGLVLELKRRVGARNTTFTSKKKPYGQVSRELAASQHANRRRNS